MLAAWVVFPAVLLGLMLGCGLLVERASGRRLAWPLVPVAGLALVIVAGQLATVSDATAELAVPLVVVLAICGVAIGARGRGIGRPEPWTVAAAMAAFAAYGAPVLLSGEPTFTGYIKLDDTATWLAMIDRVMEHGRDLGGLPPSTYEATLDLNLGKGYPVGAFIPLGIGAALAGQDPAWTFQPYLASLAALLTLGLAVVAAPLVRSPRARAAVALVAAQPALLFGYALWGGAKELAAAALLPLVAALAVGALNEPARRGLHPPSPAAGARRLIPLAFAIAALIAVLSVGGVIWLVPLLLPVAVALARRIGARTALRGAVALTVIALVLIVPAVAVGGALAPWRESLTSGDSLGNLLGPLSAAQVTGIWPSGDFRLDPELATLTWPLIVLTIAAAFTGGALAVRARAWLPLTYAAGGVAACALIVVLGSPWVDAKALAIASPCVLLAAGAAAAAGGGSTRAARRVAGYLVLAAIAAGVAWSNFLAYREVTLAPWSQLAELETIGARIAGEGPTLMTEYQPYGVRHFLRDAAPEGASELRRRRIPLRDGSVVRTGRYADTDELEPGAVLAYRTLVLRRSPVQSRPPAPYRTVFGGRYYEVWQRSGPSPGAVLGHRGLGGASEPTAVPRCAAVRRLARRAGAGGRLAAARQPPVTLLPLARATRPPGWGRVGDGRNRLIPRGSGAIEARVSVPASARYSVWIGGSVRSRLELAIDGRVIDSVRHQLNNSGQYVGLGEVRLARGTHRVTLRLGDADLHPGSGGQPLALGPLALSRAGSRRARIVRVEPRHAGRLCGRRWDWIEALS